MVVSFYEASSVICTDGRLDPTQCERLCLKLIVLWGPAQNVFQYCVTWQKITNPSKPPQPAGAAGRKLTSKFLHLWKCSITNMEDVQPLKACHAFLFGRRIKWQIVITFANARMSSYFWALLHRSAERFDSLLVM